MNFDILSKADSIAQKNDGHPVNGKYSRFAVRFAVRFVVRFCCGRWGSKFVGPVISPNCLSRSASLISQSLQPISS